MYTSPALGSLGGNVATTRVPGVAQPRTWPIGLSGEICAGRTGSSP